MTPFGSTVPPGEPNGVVLLWYCGTMNEAFSARNVSPYEYGSDFNYSVWTPGTSILLANVPWSADYRDIVDFDSPNDLDNYLSHNSGPTVEFTSVSYVRVGTPIRLSIPFNDAYRFNYLRVHNTTQPVGETRPRVFYYFILDVRHVAPNTTEFIVQLDVWNSFRWDVKFGNAYIERGHIGIADLNAFYDNGRAILAQPEGLDIGGEYSIEAVYRKKFGSAMAKEDVGFDVIIYSTVKLEGDTGTVDDPKMQTADGSRWENLPNGAAAYFVPLGQFEKMMQYLSKTPWISQGIVSIQAIPRGFVTRDDCTLVMGGGVAFYRIKNTRSDSKAVTLAENWRDDVKEIRLKGRYRHLLKFLTYPYTVVEVTTYMGSPLLLKPESMGGSGIVLTQLTHLAQPSPRIAFVPQHYNSGSAKGDPERLFKADDGAEFLDMQTGFFNFPTFALTNNSYISFMASNAHSIAYQHSAADWSQQKALSGNQMAFDNSNTAISTNAATTNIGIDARRDITNASNAASIGKSTLGGIGGVVGGAMRGGPAGALGGGAAGMMGIANSTIDAGLATHNTTITNNAAAATTNKQNEAAGIYRDRNKEYSDWAAKGDYSTAIAGINAKVQDAKLIQPTTSGQMGGEAFLLATHAWMLAAKVKMIHGGAMRNVGEYWLRYGYAINRFYHMGRSISLMSNFTYWRVKEMYVTSSKCPESFKNTIRGIFEKGVTVWRDPEMIGNLDVSDNDPIYGEYLMIDDYTVRMGDPITWADGDEVSEGVGTVVGGE